MEVSNAQRIIAHRWRQIATGSVNRRIFGATVTIGILTLAASLATMCKDIIVAASFGIGNQLDAFLIALLLPNFVINLVASSFNAALVPVYIEVRENEGSHSSQRLFAGTVAVTSGLLVAITLLLAVAGPVLLSLVGSGFDPAKLELSRGIYYVLLPTIILNGVATIWTAVLNASERFALASCSAILVPVSSGISLLLFAQAIGIYALAVGMIAGFVLQLCVLGWGLRKQGLTLLPGFRDYHPAIRRVIKQYLPMVVGSVLMSGTVLVDQAMAAILKPGSVAALNYGNKLVALVLGIGSTALATAVLPYFSKMVSARDWYALSHSLRTYVRVILLVTIPFVIIAIVLSTPLVRLFFQRGQFSAANTDLVSEVQTALLLQVPFYTLGILFVRLITSLQATHILMWGTAISFTVNLTMNFVLMTFFGVVGIAVSTTLVYVVACVFLSTMITRKLKSVEAVPV